MSGHEHDVIRVHPGVLVDGRNLGGMHLTVVAAGLSGLDATETAGGRPVRLGPADYDVVYSWWTPLLSPARTAGVLRAGDNQEEVKE